MASSRLIQLAEAIIQNTKTVDSYFKEHDLPTPSFDSEGPVDFGISPDARDVESARVKAIEASWELADLLQGPMTSLRPVASGIALQAISKWDIATKIPLGGKLSFAELAQQCQVHETDMRRILRYVMVFNRLFRETRPGYVGHSLASRLLSEEPLLRQGLWLLAEDFFSTSPHCVPALDRFRDGQEPNETAFQLANGTELSSYDFMEAHPDQARRFGMAMSSFTRFSNRPTAAPASASAKLDGAYDWAALGATGGLVVDVGGSRGLDAVGLATRHTGLRVLVQDIPKMLAGAEAALPAPLRADGRVSFMPYSFFTPQSVAADVYLIKQCFHNWPDHYCVRILKNQVPALQPGARLLIVDSVVPPPGGMSLMDERTVRAFDVMMLTSTRGREREEKEWLSILKEADERFHIASQRRLNSTGDFGPFTGIVEVVWDA